MMNMSLQRFPAPDYQTKEAINTLCANLSFMGGDIKKILVTSCHPQEGKSMVSMQLMRAMAGMGLRVALVDADIRASALQGRYDIRIDNREYMGLTQYLAGYCHEEDILGMTDIPGAYMILAGRNVINSLPLLSSPRLEVLMDRLSESFDIVIVDAPPVGTIIDAAKIARCCDGTLMVIKSGDVSRREMLETMSQMERAGSPILGTVLTEYDERKYGGKYYYHKSYYTAQYGGQRKEKKRPGFLGLMKKKAVDDEQD